MPRRYFFYCFVNVLVALPTLAQRLEHHIEFSIKKGEEIEFYVESLNEQKLCIIQKLAHRSADSVRWIAHELDSAFAFTSEVEMHTEKLYQLIFFSFDDQSLCLVFREPYQPKLLLHVIDRATKAAAQHVITLPEEFTLTHLQVLWQTVVLADATAKSPLILMINTQSWIVKIFPLLYVAGRCQLLDLKAVDAKAFIILLYLQHASEKKMVQKVINTDGEVVLETEAPIAENRAILEARISELGHKDLLIAGSWTTKQRRTPSGIFTWRVRPYGKNKPFYYIFSELESFLKYRKSAAQARIMKRMVRRQKKGKASDILEDIHIGKLTDTPEGFSLMFLLAKEEAKKTSNAQYSTLYNRYDRNLINTAPLGYYYPLLPYQASLEEEGISTRYFLQQITLMNFNEAGECVGDISLPIKLRGSIKILSTTADFAHFAKHSAIVAIDRNNLVTYQTGETEQISSIKLFDDKELSDTEKNANKDNGVKHWYQNYFYTWGYKNEASSPEKKGENSLLFFVDKIALPLSP